MWNNPNHHLYRRKESGVYYFQHSKCKKINLKTKDVEEARRLRDEMLRQAEFVERVRASETNGIVKEAPRFIYDPKTVSVYNSNQEALDTKASTLYSSAKYRAKKRVYAFDLTVDWVKEKIINGCEVSKIPFYIGVDNRYKKHPYSPSIDRIDNLKGYTQSNSRVVVWVYNLMKNEYPDWVLLDFAKVLLHNNQEITIRKDYYGG